MPQPRTPLDHRMRAIEGDLLAMADLGVSRTRAALAAWRAGDRAAAARVVAEDELVDETCLRVERRVLLTQVTLAPVARDQRLLHVARIVCVALERVGDLASAIARLTGDPPPRGPWADRVLARLDDLADMAVGALVRVREALATDDARMAARLAASAPRARHALRELVVEVADRGAADDPGLAAAAVLLGRHLERLCDNAAVVARRLVFLSTGRLPDRVVLGAALDARAVSGPGAAA